MKAHSPDRFHALVPKLKLVLLEDVNVYTLEGYVNVR